MKRKSGYYWVIRSKKWEVAQFVNVKNASGYWIIMGVLINDFIEIKDNDLKKIDERQILKKQLIR